MVADECLLGEAVAEAERRSRRGRRGRRGRRRPKLVAWTDLDRELARAALARLEDESSHE